MRNLDFRYTDVMKTLVYDAMVYKNGEKVGEAPSIAGFYGIFTARKTGKFSLSFNVRKSDEGGTYDSIMCNLARNLDPTRVT